MNPVDPSCSSREDQLAAENRALIAERDALLAQREARRQEVAEFVEHARERETEIQEFTATVRRHVDRQTAVLRALAETDGPIIRTAARWTDDRGRQVAPSAAVNEDGDVIVGLYPAAGTWRINVSSGHGEDGRRRLREWAAAINRLTASPIPQPADEEDSICAASNKTGTAVCTRPRHTDDRHVASNDLGEIVCIWKDDTSAPAVREASAPGSAFAQLIESAERVAERLNHELDDYPAYSCFIDEVHAAEAEYAAAEHDRETLAEAIRDYLAVDGAYASYDGHARQRMLAALQALTGRPDNDECAQRFRRVTAREMADAMQADEARRERPCDLAPQPARHAIYEAHRARGLVRVLVSEGPAPKGHVIAISDDTFTVRDSAGEDQVVDWTSVRVAVPVADA